MNLNHEIDAVVARLSAGEDPRPILTEFARAVQKAGNVTIDREVAKCSSCGTQDAVCFQCKSLSLVGEKGMAALPFLLPKLGEMVMGWAADRKLKKEAQQSRQGTQPEYHSPPPPRGPQRF